MKVMTEDDAIRFMNHCHKTSLKSCKKCDNPLPNELLPNLLLGERFQCDCGCMEWGDNPYNVFTYTKVAVMFKEVKEERPQFNLVFGH